MADNPTETQLVGKPTATALFPDLRQAKVSVGFVLFTLGGALAISTTRLPWHPSFIESIVALTAQIGLVGIVWIFSISFFTTRRSPPIVSRSYAIAWLMLQAISICALFIAYRLLPMDFTQQHLPVPSSLILAAALGVIAVHHFYLHARWRQAQTQSQTAHFQTLSAQIHPHFLFNTLNTIAELTRSDPEAAEHAVESLALLYRMQLAGAQDQASMAEEIHIAQSYLYIEQHRFGEKLEPIWNTDSLPKDAQLPILTLQPLIENAIYHGIGSCLNGGKLVISGWQEGKELLLSVTNPIPEIKRNNRQAGNNMAIENIRQRLNITFGNQANMRTETTDKEYRVTLRFPYLTNQPQG